MGSFASHLGRLQVSNFNKLVIDIMTTKENILVESIDYNFKLKYLYDFKYTYIIVLDYNLGKQPLNYNVIDSSPRKILEDLKFGLIKQAMYRIKQLPECIVDSMFEYNIFPDMTSSIGLL